MKAGKDRPVRLQARGNATKQRILDAAEDLFSQRGFDGVTIKDIVEASGSKTGQIIHHFGTKDDLFTAVILRRAPEVARDHAVSADRLQNTPDTDLSLKLIISAFLEYSHGKLLGPDVRGHKYLRLLGLCTVTYNLKGYIVEHQAYFRPINVTFQRELGRLYPQASNEKLKSAFFMMEGCLVNILIKGDSFDQDNSQDRASSIEQLFTDTEAFLIGGVHNLLTV